MNVLDSKFMQEMISTMDNMYRLGWNERNGGNITYLLDQTEVEKYLDINNVIREIDIKFNAKELANKYFLVSGTNQFFKNTKSDPHNVLGIVRVKDCGTKLDLLWGFENGHGPTSELPTHFMGHIARLKVDKENRIIMHCHASHLVAMSFTHSLDEIALTKTLWEMCTECIVVFPDGVGVVPWMVPGTTQIGEATSAKMAETRLIMWPFHGIYGAGRTMDETFGLIETAEKAAQVYTYISAAGGKRQSITDAQLEDLAKAFGVTPKTGVLHQR